MARDFSKSFYSSREWKQVREYCMLRDHHECVLCGSPAEEVHHKIYLSPENINDINITLNPDNLISLCKDCHFEQHRGQHGRGRIVEEEYPFVFDENGFLIEKNNIPPSNIHSI